MKNNSTSKESLENFCVVLLFFLYFSLKILPDEKNMDYPFVFSYFLHTT